MTPREQKINKMFGQEVKPLTCKFCQKKKVFWTSKNFDKPDIYLCMACGKTQPKPNE